jgi:dihydroneopterin aldolase
MRFHSFHGHYAEEQSVGNDYDIDIILETDIEYSSLEDDLNNTINYEKVYSICKNEMSKPRRLIETVGNEIIKEIELNFPLVRKTSIILRKNNPMLGGLVEHAAVELSSEK